MSKAKELARELHDAFLPCYSEEEVRENLERLISCVLSENNAVLSEPEPLRGWIEVTFMRKSDPNNNENKALLDVKTIKMICFDSDLRKVGIEFHNQVDTCFHVQESYDEIKNKIARAG